MKKAIFLGIAVLSVFATAVVSSESDVTKQEVQLTIETAYINGAFNDLDTEAMKNGFHPSFRLHGVRDDGTLSQWRIDDWIESIETKKKKSDFDPEDQKWDHKIAFIDATGPAAIAKIELFKEGQHVYTDYLSLMKLADGWTITDKVYYRHPDL